MREISEEIMQEYQKIKDMVTLEEFSEEMERRRRDYDEVSFMGDLQLAQLIVGEHIEEKNQPLTSDKNPPKISELEVGQDKIVLIGRIMHMSNIKTFTTRKGAEGKLANLILADKTGQIRVVFWSENIRFLKNLKEGDAVKIKGVEIKQGFREDEAHLNLRSTVEKLPKEDYTDFPAYNEKITPLCDVEGDMEVNVVARLVRIPRIRTFDRNGNEGKVASLEIQDQSGKMFFTLWNKDTELIKTLKLQEGDVIKIHGARSRMRNGEVSLSHSWLGRVEKLEDEDIDVPEYQENILKIGDAQQMKDATIIGVASKVYDEITFERDDGTSGRVKSIELRDDEASGSIRVTLWNDDTSLDIKKGDIVKISGGNIEFDDYSITGYRMNTNWNTTIQINPPLDSKTLSELEELKKYLNPFKIGDIQQLEDDGEEIDVIGRIVSIYEPNEFQREDGTTGKVRTIELADDTGVVRVSLWDEKAQGQLNQGDAIKIENARIRLGEANVDLSVGKTSRILQPTPEEMKDLPSVEDVSSQLFQDKKITELQEGDREARLIGRIISLFEPREFTRQDGTKGLVRSVEIGDETGIVRASLWDDQANTPLNEGDAVKIENPRVNIRNDEVEISAGRSTQITKVKEEESELPSLKDIQEKIYPMKNIEDIEDGDRNIKVKGTILEARGNKILYERCPACNKKVEWIDGVFVCEECSQETENPNFMMIIPIALEDDTGTIRITFFQELAEELLGLTTQEALDIIEKTGDEGSIEEKVTDILNREITVLGDASYDDYSEDLKLNPRKILDQKI